MLSGTRISPFFEKDKMFASLSISDKYEITQYSGESNAFRLGYLLGNSGVFIFLCVLGIGFVIVVIFIIRRK